MPARLRQIADRFRIPGRFIRAQPVQRGHINDTFAATYEWNGAPTRYIHQRINRRVFRDPERQMQNIERVTLHTANKLREENVPEPARRALTLVPTTDGASFLVDDEGEYWRTYRMVEDARTYDVATSPEQAYQAAKAFAQFQRLLHDLPGPRLHGTIPDFHHTPKRVEDLKGAVRHDPHGRVREARGHIDFALAREDRAGELLALQGRGEIPERVVHNDTKLNNVLFDEGTGEAICVIDLDTVMPGLALYDFGDMVRTTTSPAAEDETDLSRVDMRMDMYEALCTGYLDEMGAFLVNPERERLAFAGALITYEVGVRFLTDFLLGDTYFKVTHPGHNLERCRNQFRLLACIERRAQDMQRVVNRPTW